MPTIEHRKLFRARIAVQIAYETLSKPVVNGVFLTTDVSSSGACVIGTKKLELDTDLKLNIFFQEGANPVAASGKIIWKKQCQYVPQSKHVYYAYGLRFLEMTPSDAIKTSDYVYEMVRASHEMEERETIQQLEKIKQGQ